MNRLQSELHRLYLQPVPPGSEGVRAAMLALAKPADWGALSAVWRGVQSDLGLPAPAIAVSGTDAYQLWFSFAEPLPQAQAQAFVEALRTRYLGEIAGARIGMLSAPDALANALPPRQAGSGQWSAFVAPDLAPVFAEEPFLDTEPGAEGQADLLARLPSMRSADMRAAQAQLGLGPAQAPSSVAAAAPPAPGDDRLEARRFLRQVMQDDSVTLALRIEAAKALLG